MSSDLLSRYEAVGADNAFHLRESYPFDLFPTHLYLRPQDRTKTEVSSPLIKGIFCLIINLKNEFIKKYKKAKLIMLPT